MDYGISTDPAARVRIDKWLWAARFYKTRSLAAQAVTKGRIRLNGATVKAAHEVRCGERIEIDSDGIVREVRVRAVGAIRGPAQIAQTLYEEDAQSVARRIAENERRRLYREPANSLVGRPTKRERRALDKLGESD